MDATDIGSLRPGGAGRGASPRDPILQVADSDRHAGETYTPRRREGAIAQGKSVGACTMMKPAVEPAEQQHWVICAAVDDLLHRSYA
jgi:hypothetical protein